ncbi:MAG: carbohydrate binding domain-containing protein [Paenibacillaceae bacterium]
MFKWIQRKISVRKYIVLSLCIILSFAFTFESAFARDSVFSRKGSGPMYWIGYENAFDTDAALPEARWVSNVDWVSQNLLPYGYDMVSTDGWIEGSSVTNANGYITKYNDGWTRTWDDMVTYATSKGLKAGVYYNPLWVSPYAVNDATKTVIGNPSIKISDIVNKTYDFNTVKFRSPSYPLGDRFGYSSNSANDAKTLYWLDVTKPGAKEYLQGYVNFFKAKGFKFLRVDFLSYYEDGLDGNDGSLTGKAHGAADYKTALQWMQEACGDDMLLSLVMPNLHGHGTNEVPTGDMIRIDQDVFGGGWDHLSGRSQGWKDSWSQWANVFQGTTGFSDVSGRGGMILDSDFIRLNKMDSSTYAASEKKTNLSIFAMAGSPLAVADQYDTIGSNLSYYQNTELNELNQNGFFGRPIYNSGVPFYTDGSSRDSERWVGQMPNGDWVISLFNRSDVWKTQTINFASDLGIQGNAFVRDIWGHSNTGLNQTSHSLSLSPHDSSVVKVVPNSLNKRYEAEVASLINGAGINKNHTGYSAFGFVDKFEAKPAGVATSKITFAIDAPKAGTFRMNARYANAMGSNSTGTLSVKDSNNVAVGSTQAVTLPTLANWDTWSDKTVNVQLAEGLNLLSIERTASDIGAFNLDYIDFNFRNAVVNPGFETGTINGWTESRPVGQTAAYGVDSPDAYSGTNKLYFYSASAYQEAINQTVAGLPNGTYNISAWVKLNAPTTPTTAQLEVSGYGSSQVNVAIPNNNTWTQIKTTVSVTSGQATVKFNLNAPANTSLQMDDVAIDSNIAAMFNSDFSSNYTDWSRSNVVNTSIATLSGNNYAHVGSATGYSSDLWRYERLASGTYTLTAKVRSSGTFTSNVLYIDYNGTTKTVAVPSSPSTWVAVTISGITLPHDGAVKVGLFNQGNGGSWAELDDVQITN